MAWRFTPNSIQPVTRITAHILNHTHWDREWFLTSVYTTPWIPGLIDHLQALVDQNPGFRFYLDGQTLVIEDLLQFDPNYREKVDRLIRSGNLLIGPYYCQPDWRLTSGEGLLRNLLLGRQDMEQYGVRTETGWLVDTFGHISQAPQLHHLFGINSVYIWRGAPQLEPYFHWHGADGTGLLAINLFAGYRNLYGVTYVPEIAIKRLQIEVKKLQPYYPSPDIPLFDGYDLEDNPEDPLRFYQARRKEFPPEIQILDSTPESFARLIQQTLPELPIILGELLSGKYGSVFPGTLSTRNYLKVMARDCEYLLYQVCEPLGTMARMVGRIYPEKQYEAWSRGLLQNAVHDCICGVSIDQVHEKMEFSYRQIFEGILEDIRESLAFILRDFAPGDYAISTSPFLYEGWHVLGDKLCFINTYGVGVWEIEESLPIQQTEDPVEAFEWKNRYYEARVSREGNVRIGKAVLGMLLVHEENGDTYSDEIGHFLGALRPGGPIVVEEKSELHCVLRLDCFASWGARQVSARLRLTFDPSPLIRWRVDLDSRGTDFRVDMVFETGRPGQVYTGMPFDIVQRPAIDRDLLPRQLDENLAALLLGQRELGSTRTFPFHDFIAIADRSSSAVVLARGLHAYQADENGQVTVTLRRAVEWLAKPDLKNRVGDAGPFFYVPDARCERSVTHELAFLSVKGGIEDPQIQALNAGFQNPPLFVESKTIGSQRNWQFFQESLPLSSMFFAHGRIMARLSNPYTHAHHLSKAYLSTDVSGSPKAHVDRIPSKSILTLVIDEPTHGFLKKGVWGGRRRLCRLLPPQIPLCPRPGAGVRGWGKAGLSTFRKPYEPTASVLHGPDTAVILLNPPAWRVGPNQGLPDPKTIQQLKEYMAQLEQQIEEISIRKPQAGNPEHYHWQHQIYVLERELLEYRLSARLNEIKLAMQGERSYDYLYRLDEEIAAIGRKLNQLRIQRRIYDYVILAV